MFTKLTVINLGLGKIASSQVSRIDPPQSSLERFVAAGYEHWKRSELTKRRWVFAMDDDVALPQVAFTEGAERPYGYDIPADALRPVRNRTTEWKQRRRRIYSACEGLKVTLIMNVPEAEFDPLFVEVLACRVALESAEFVTQSNSKVQTAEALYTAAVADAGRANAYVIGPEDYNADDSEFDFLNSRM